MIGSHPIQAEYKPPVETSIVETAPEIHNPILDQVTFKKITTMQEPIKSPTFNEIEKLEQVPPPAPKPSQTASTSASGQARQVSHSRPNAPTGWFPYGQCTYYVWSKRPVGHWNNASEWYWQAQRDGWSTGTTPRVGAIGVENGVNHVVYVESVNGNTVRVSEMNYRGHGVVSSRTESASSFRYIY